MFLFKLFLKDDTQVMSNDFSFEISVITLQLNSDQNVNVFTGFVIK